MNGVVEPSGTETLLKHAKYSPFTYYYSDHV